MIEKKRNHRAQKTTIPLFLGGFLLTLLLIEYFTASVSLADSDTQKNGLDRKWKSENIVLTDGKNKTTLRVDLALTENERARGLMFRAKLGINEGMFFDFKTPQGISLWMKNVTMPLEAACFDEKGRLIETFIMQPCKTDPCPIYSSQSQQVRYLIEWTPGFLKTKNLIPGTTRIENLKKFLKQIESTSY
jgi:uncharacterized membrane protein (UPF0127 family)